MESAKNSNDWTKVAEIEIVYRTKVKPSQRPKITSSAEAYQLLINNWDANLVELQEQMKVVLFNMRKGVLGIYTCSSGGISGTVADPRLIIAAAVKSGACAIMLSHNHPSGDIQPSHADKCLTYKIKEALRYFDIVLLDHLIISREQYYSFADEGVL